MTQYQSTSRLIATGNLISAPDSLHVLQSSHDTEKHPIIMRLKVAYYDVYDQDSHFTPLQT